MLCNDFFIIFMLKVKSKTNVKNNTFFKQKLKKSILYYFLIVMCFIVEVNIKCKVSKRF